MCRVVWCVFGCLLALRGRFLQSGAGCTPPQEDGFAQCARFTEGGAELASSQYSYGRTRSELFSWDHSAATIRIVGIKTGGKPMWWANVRPSPLLLCLLSTVLLVVLRAPRGSDVLLGGDKVLGIAAHAVLKPSSTIRPPSIYPSVIVTRKW